MSVIINTVMENTEAITVAVLRAGSGMNGQRYITSMFIILSKLTVTCDDRTQDDEGVEMTSILCRKNTMTPKMTEGGIMTVGRKIDIDTVQRNMASRSRGAHRSNTTASWMLEEGTVASGSTKSRGVT